MRIRGGVSSVMTQIEKSITTWFTSHNYRPELVLRLLRIARSKYSSEQAVVRINSFKNNQS